MPYRRDEVPTAERFRRTVVHLETAQRIGRMGSWEGELRGEHRIYWSPETRRIAAWPEDAPDPTFAEFLALVHPDDRERYLAMRDDALAGRGPYEIDCRFTTVGGVLRYVHLAAEIERDDSGQPIRLIGIVQDVTERVEMLSRMAEGENTRRALLHRLFEAGEAERAALAARLHDGPVQELSAVALRLENARGPSDAAGVVADVLPTVHDVIRSLRGTLFELHPTPLGHDGIGATLEHLVGLVPGVERTVEVDLADGIGERTATAVTRIAQEALHNIRRHAGASRVEIRLRANGDVLLEVSDDGHGFDTGAPRRPGHLGLHSMRERAEAAGGTLHIESGAGGTRVEARLPH